MGGERTSAIRGPTDASDPGCVKTHRCYDSLAESAVEAMRGFVQGADRQQTTLLPECLDGRAATNLWALEVGWEFRAGTLNTGHQLAPISLHAATAAGASLAPPTERRPSLRDMR
jgi:hypothetical protein